MSPIFFVHVPKTAGTSFRLGAEEFFGRERIVYDYGPDSSVTDPLVKDLLYGETKDFWGFKLACHQRDTAMIGGHVGVGRFLALFGAGRTLTFLREPLQRIASEYGHFVRHFDYKGSFEDFYSRPTMQNRQSKLLQGIEIETIGFAGLTERYARSLELLNAHFGTEIALRADNRGKQSLQAVHEFSPRDEAELKRLNRRDLALYAQAVTLFDSRYHFFKEDKPWAHARLDALKPDRISGCAWWAGNSEEPVEVEVSINDEQVAALLAVDLRPPLRRQQPPRGGYVGFELAVTLSADDRVQCRVAQTGQRFPWKPRTLPRQEAG